MRLAAPFVTRGLGFFAETLRLIVPVSDFTIILKLHFQIVLIRLAGQERKVLLVSICVTHATVGMEVRDS